MTAWRKGLAQKDRPAVAYADVPAFEEFIAAELAGGHDDMAGVAFLVVSAGRATDKKPRRRSGYVARWERERASR